MSEGSDKVDRRSVLKGIATVGAVSLLPKESVAQREPESIPLRGKELDKARYDFLRSGFSERPFHGQKDLYKAYMSILEGGKRVFEETACVFLEKDGNVRVQGKSFEFTLSPYGVVSGTIPPHVEHFLQFERRGQAVENSYLGKDRGMGMNYVETCDPLVS